MRLQSSSSVETTTAQRPDNHVRPDTEEVVMGGKKHILIKSSSIHAVCSDFESMWEDIWLVFKAGRKPVHLGPTMHARSMVEYEIRGAIDSIEELEQKLAAGETKTKTSIVTDPKPEDVFEVDNAEMLEHYRHELTFWQGIEARLATGNAFAFDDSHEAGCPDIFINAEFLTRANIEAGLEYYLRAKEYLKPGSAPKFHWQRPKILCRSCTD